MAEKLTAQQQQAVTDRGGKLLVSAAAGSGKTKVLVDRIMSYLTDQNDPANIDDFLIITYTKAAAAELRGKIAARLSQLMTQNASNRHLQVQMQRLYLTKISTVHAFCSDFLRDYAYRLDIAGDFRVAEENECLELQTRVLQRLMDEAYANASDDPDFCALLDTQGFGRDDRQIPEIVSKLYNSAKCHLDPDGWLEECLQLNDISGVNDASETIWGKYLIDDLHEYLDIQIDAIDQCASSADLADGMEKPAALMRETSLQLKALRNCTAWDDILGCMHVDYGRLTFPKGRSDSDLAIRIKKVRENCKKGLAKKLRRFSDSSAQILSDLETLSASARGLVDLTRRFMESYDKAKRSKRMLDFSDLEHKTLDLLLGKKRSGPTAIAREVGKRYREVMVDEYQDSNGVQDAIFDAITAQRQNCFMVGDVKQSIYQFRLADPGIFLAKYNTYLPAVTAVDGQGRKVLLSSNFRSAGSVIGAVNDVFYACMSPKVGGLSYTEAEALQEGIPHAAVNEPEIELYGISVNENTYEEEAGFVAHRISQLLDGKHMVRQGESLRPIVKGDIVILLRSPGSVGIHFVRALENMGIRCTNGTSTNLLQTDEIQTLRAVLQTIDNPLQEIPLVAALTSCVFGFTADDLAIIRSEDRNCSLYTALRKSRMDKAVEFTKTLDVLRMEARMNSLPGLVNRVFSVTGLDSLFAAMPDGQQRMENLQSFYQLVSNFDAGGAKNLSHFLQYLEVLDDKGLATSGETGNTDAVTIMSIHKSKGLEFPVVFLCGLSREFNRDSTREQVLCDKEFGIGLGCVDSKNGVRYPSVAKRAIAAKMTAQNLSEEMRVLYVAMTRPKDRLIMTYAAQNLEKDLQDIACRMDFGDPLLMTGDVDCPGKWILYSALKRGEAGAFFALGGYPSQTQVSNDPWLIRVVRAPEQESASLQREQVNSVQLPVQVVSRLKETLKFQYPYLSATKTPSKQTATQLKGRAKDAEAAENTVGAHGFVPDFRKPSFIQESRTGKFYGNAVHKVMQYIRYDACADITGVDGEIRRLCAEGYISQEEANVVNGKSIAQFFATELGAKLRTGKNVLREFKFSVLEDANQYDSDLTGERILLQGVVDCALMEEDGITIIDFKTDCASDENLQTLVARYRSQITVYANALSRIYQMPVKSKLLYFFNPGRFVAL